MKKVMLVVMGLLLLAFGYVLAEETVVESVNPEPTVEIEKTEPTSPGEEKVISKLSRQFNVEEKTIVNLRTQGYGYGEISHALVIAEKSGKPLEEIISLRNSGMGWGQISKHYNLSLGMIKKDVSKVKKDIKNDIPRRTMMGKPQRPEKPGRPECPAKPRNFYKHEKPSKP